jgi:DNA-directed RNA polymerase specialized sigma24 family protein
MATDTCVKAGSVPRFSASLEKAFLHITRKYFRIGCFNRGLGFDWDDLYQECLIKFCAVAERYKDIEDPDKFEAIVRSSVHNRIVDLITYQVDRFFNCVCTNTFEGSDEASSSLGSVVGFFSPGGDFFWTGNQTLAQLATTTVDTQDIIDTIDAVVPKSGDLRVLWDNCLTRMRSGKEVTWCAEVGEDLGWEKYKYFRVLSRLRKIIFCALSIDVEAV